MVRVEQFTGRVVVREEKNIDQIFSELSPVAKANVAQALIACSGLMDDGPGDAYVTADWHWHDKDIDVFAERLLDVALDELYEQEKDDEGYVYLTGETYEDWYETFAYEKHEYKKEISDDIRGNATVTKNLFKLLHFSDLSEALEAAKYKSDVDWWKPELSSEEWSKLCDCLYHEIETWFRSAEDRHD
jgi:hypothetical protein